MIMKPYKWRTINETYKYVDSATGSDLYGDGTMDKPYQSLRKAYNTRGSSTVIVCRGYFSESMSDGNHATTIIGDYYGAATFDGGCDDSNPSIGYIIYGFTHNNMIIKNTPSYIPTSLPVASGSAAFAGVGRASSAGGVGGAGSVIGVSGSSVLLDRTLLYWGAAGGNTACHHVCYSRPKWGGTYKVSLSNTGTGQIGQNTYYGLNIEDATNKISGSGGNPYWQCIFSNWAMFVDDKCTYDTCLFDADCKWYYNKKIDDVNTEITELIITGDTSIERLQSLNAAIIDAGIPSANRPVFARCKFTTQTAKNIFNNIDIQDFTLSVNGDGVIEKGLYYGAFPPALNIPILSDSSQIPNTWNENSAAGCVKVIDNMICLDENSTDLRGEISTKAIKLNVEKYSINAIFSEYASKFHTHNMYLWADSTPYGALVNKTPIDPDTEIPIGKYVVDGIIKYNNNTTIIQLNPHTILDVTIAGTSYEAISAETGLYQILDGNISDVVYVRSTPLLYDYLKSTDDLETGATYINNGNYNITYRSKTIVPGESFVAMNNTEHWSCAEDANYKIGILFDDTRVPIQEWIPAQLFGEYFVWKRDGVIQKDDNDVPISSGNYWSYQTELNGGYKEKIFKTPLNDRYAQFKFIAQRYKN